ncbi:MAG: hypothetical protein RQ856_06510, partial [Candidatus Izemoplasmatales bacterium]|nr:hypothetical protein [Candidatus Izemoplasmatales bacterium]
ILDVQTFFIGKRADTALSKNHLFTEKHNIFRLDKAINSYLKYEMRINNLNRTYLSYVTNLLVNYIRNSEAHNIELVEALSGVKLALKEYDITAIHFKTMFENEKRFLVMQSNRVNDETKINNEFILTGYMNQMRFAEEQINLANDEFKIRVQAIMTAVDEERQYYDDIIENQERQSKKRKDDLIDEYKSKLYQYNYLIEENVNNKDKNSLSKELAKLKERYDKKIKDSEITLSENEITINARRRLRNLDDHLEEALTEAVNLRDDTIDEMQELYNSAKERYEYLKVYLENKIDPLEPTFHQTLERMQGRYQFKLKTAEAELDYKTKDLLDNYINIYFEEQPGLDQNKVLEYINQIQIEKDKITEEYHAEINDIEVIHQDVMTKLSDEKKQIIEEAKSLTESVKNKEDLEISQKQQELQLLENRYVQQQLQKQNFYENEIETLTSEYNSTLIQSKRYINSLSQAFEKVLNTYKPYIKLTKNNRKIRTIMKKTTKQINRKEKRELKTLARDLKKKQMLINDLRD